MVPCFSNYLFLSLNYIEGYYTRLCIDFVLFKQSIQVVMRKL